MDDFAAWFDRAGAPAGDIPECLDGCECASADGGYRYPCVVCGEDHDIMCDPSEFDPDMHYCGGSPICCP